MAEGEAGYIDPPGKTVSYSVLHDVDDDQGWLPDGVAFTGAGRLMARPNRAHTHRKH